MPSNINIGIKKLDNSPKSKAYNDVIFLEEDEKEEIFLKNQPTNEEVEKSSQENFYRNNHETIQNNNKFNEIFENIDKNSLLFDKYNYHNYHNYLPLEYNSKSSDHHSPINGNLIPGNIICDIPKRIILARFNIYNEIMCLLEWRRRYDGTVFKHPKKNLV